MTGSLFDTLQAGESPHIAWRPEAPPVLDGITDIELDCETTGLRWWDTDRPIGISVCLPDGRTQYLPWGHRGGGNLDEETVRRWAQRELRGKRITNLNTRFDVHMLHQWGVDLEAQGCTVSDVSHYAALLDDHRFRFSQEALCADYLPPEERKVTAVGGIALDTTRMADYHAGIVAVRAEADVRQVQMLKRIMWPLLDAENLQRVRTLEDQVIYVVCEMERNGAIIDMALLERWIQESQRTATGYLMEIYNDLGIRFNPDSNDDWQRLFALRKIPITEYTSKGRPSFTANALKPHLHDRYIKLGFLAGKIADLNSKYLHKYRENVDSHNVLRYALHQLRSQKNEYDESDVGTVSGRFSSSEIVPGFGVNIQQVMKVAKQRVTFGYDEEDASHDNEIFIIRQLHVPAEGLFLSADAEQIEYRIFAHHANNPRILEAYRENPRQNFHKFIWSLIKPYAALTYRQQKDLNFAKIYGAGLKKLALMLGFISESQFRELNDKKAPNTHLWLEKAAEVERIYAREIPEVGPLLKRASDVARTRGYVMTILGRRMRFPEKQRLHKAFNGIDQGTAADINKQKLVELHRERKHTGLTLRFTVHDEVDGDVPDEESAKRVGEILDAQSFPQLRVPILWDVSTGSNWKECS